MSYQFSPIPSVAALTGASYDSLIQHSQYAHGGLEDLNTLICLRKLTTTFASPSHPQKLVLPMPRTALFAEYSTLAWFPLVAHGLGIHLHCVEQVPFSDTGPGYLTVTWRQRWGKKEFASGVGEVGVIDAKEVQRRAVELQPELMSLPRARLNAYYRRLCRGGIRWFDVHSEDGGQA